MASHLLPLSSSIPSSPMSPDDDEDEEEEKRKEQDEEDTTTHHHHQRKKSSSSSSTSSTPQPHRIIIQKSSFKSKSHHRQRNNSKKLMSITSSSDEDHSGSGTRTPPQRHLHRRKGNRIIKNENFKISNSSTTTTPEEFNNNNNNNYEKGRPLKWVEHGENIESAMSHYLANEMFVDVTILLRAELQNHSSKSSNEIKAHKIILASFSEYFYKLLIENPCKHPVIMLQDFERWEIEGIINFMYNGELCLQNEKQLEMLLKTAEALQIRGLVECIQKLKSEEEKIKPISNMEVEDNLMRAKTCHNSPKFDDEEEADDAYGPTSPKLLNLSMQIPKRDDDNNYEQKISVRNGPKPQTTTVIMTGGGSKIGDLNSRNLNLGPDSCSSFPRRKQARPRRRSGDFVAQDLRVINSDRRFDSDAEDGDGDELSLSEKDLNNHVLDFTINRADGIGIGSGGEGESYRAFTIPNLWIKNETLAKRETDSGEENLPSPISYMKPETPDSLYGLEAEKNSRRGPKRSHRTNEPSLDLNPFKLSPSSPSFLLNLTNGHPLSLPLSGHFSDTESNPHSDTHTPPTVFSPHGYPMTIPPNPGTKNNPNNTASSPNSGVNQQQPHWPGLHIGGGPLFGRHRAQHSAPRGGPPRAWSNSDLTEALHNVWNKKMTTSQASRIFGIPYNSLLMYVRGKYGKSLKLDLLKKGLDLANEKSSIKNNPSTRTSPSSNNNNNNNNNNANRKTPPTQNSGSGGGGGCDLTSNHNNSQNKSKSGGSSSSPMGSGPSLNLSTLMGHSGNNNKIVTDPHSHHSHPHHLQSLLHHQDPSQGGFNPFAAAAAAVAGSIFGEFGPSAGHYPFPGAGAFLPPPGPQHHQHHPALMLNEKSNANTRRQQQHDIEK